MKIVYAFLFAAVVLLDDQALAEVKLNIPGIEQNTGMRGKYDEKEDIFKVTYPQNGLFVTVAGVKLTPPMGLSSWAAFKNAGDKTIVTGDFVLLEDQVNPVMSVALENGLDVTALHNHFFWDTPKVMFMHLGGIGDEGKLSAAIGKVFNKLKETAGGQGTAPWADINPAESSLGTKKIDRILGKEGDLSNGVYKIIFGRKVKMKENEIGSAMGVNTWAAFAGKDDKAVVDGDFAVYEEELRRVLTALRKANINIVAIHNHMIMEEPRVVFLHYWGLGPAEELAKGIKSALDTQK
ncbi:MAG: DUF1259 domain-containing protein [Deltaproteobacteria bacterium]|nr:DUF1259 domain-containing protein [Deltaproteobacteria bacterium]